MNDQRRPDRNDRFQGNEDFVQRVLGATSGSACARAEALLPDLADGRLEGLDRQLVQAHLEHCGRCRDLAVTLTWVAPLLPELAEVDPGPDFLAGVLARTSRAPAEAALDEARPGVFGRLLRRGHHWWRRQVQRPAFAVEFAYAATLVLLLLTAVPGAPLKGTPDRALRVVSAGVGAWPALEYHLGNGAGWLADHVETAATAGWTAVGRRFEPVATEWRERVDDTAADRAAVDQHFDHTVDLLKEGRLQEAGYSGQQLVKSVREFWRHWWSDS